MSRLVEARPMHRLRAEPSQAAPARHRTPLDESEEEPEAAELAGATAPASSALQPARALEPAEAFAQAMVRCLDSLKSGSGKQSVLDRALDASGGGSLDGSLNSGRRNAAARKALRDSLTSAPQKISKMIEALMAEDLNASTPGAGSPVLTSTRAWLEHRSRIQAFPSMVHLTWAIAGALDCLRASKPEQARARLNIALLQADQCSIDRGSLLLAQELSLELGPPMSSFRKRDNAAGDPAYSRLLDPRWAEIALSRLREEAEFTDRRQKLSNRTTTTNKDQDEAAADPGERPGLWKKRLVNLTVARLSYEHLGCPSSCPSTVRLGVSLNRKQWQQDYGRIGHKVEGQAKTLSALGAPSELGPSPVQVVGTLPGKPDIAAMPIVADRVKLPATPSFEASPFMDRATSDFFENPLHHARVPDPAAEKPPFVKILADSRQKLLLLQALARSGRLEPLSAVPAERADWGAGLFAVAKDGARDRLVLDARPANELEDLPGRWVHTLASAACLGCLHLWPDEIMIMSGTDLQDCFYQFRVTPERHVRNHIACKLTPQEAAFVFDRPVDSFCDFGDVVLCGLSSLAMGDSSACEFAQCSHLGVLAQARVVHPGELLVQASAPPRGLLSVGLVIDDLIILQRYSDKKTFEDKTQ
ncbi:unnamed protein product, partial [Symbiodinium sp. KB8]